MQPKIEKRKSKIPCRVAAGVIIALTLLALYPLYYLMAVRQIHDASYADAVLLLERGLRFRRADPALWKKLGDAYYSMASGKAADEAYRPTIKSKQAYLAARRLNRLDAETHPEAIA